MKPHSYHLLGFFVSHLANFFLTYFSCYSFVLSVTVCILFISSSQYFLQLLTFIFQIIVNTSIPFLSFFAWKNNFSFRPKLIFILKSFLELYITLFSLKSQAYFSISFGSYFVAISSIPRSINSFLWFLLIIRYLKRENIDWYQHIIILIMFKFFEIDKNKSTHTEFHILVKPLSLDIPFVGALLSFWVQ